MMVMVMGMVLEEEEDEVETHDDEVADNVAVPKPKRRASKTNRPKVQTGGKGNKSAKRRKTVAESEDEEDDDDDDDDDAAGSANTQTIGNIGDDLTEGQEDPSLLGKRALTLEPDWSEYEYIPEYEWDGDAYKPKIGDYVRSKTSVRYGELVNVSGGCRLTVTVKWYANATLDAEENNGILKSKLQKLVKKKKI